MENRFSVFTLEELQNIKMGMVSGKLEEELRQAFDAKLEDAAKKIGNLPVFGGTIFWHDDRNTNRHKQARVVVAAKSKAAVKRAFPCLNRIELCKTGNGRELSAVQKPLTLYVRQLNAYDGPLFELTPEESASLR